MKASDLYKLYIISYFDLKDQVFLRAKIFERKISDDIIDPNILPTQVEEIENLINELAVTSRDLDNTFTKLHSSSIFFGKKNYSTIQTFFEKEIGGFGKFFTYILSLIKKWLEWHKEELQDEYLRIQNQISELQSTNPELGSVLELSNQRFREHIKTTEKVLIHI